MTAQMERLDRVVICFHFSNFEPLETAALFVNVIILQL